MKDIDPDEVVYSRKQMTVYEFRDVQAGQYELKLHQRFKGSRKGCVVPFTITIDARKAASTGFEQKPSSLTIWQSQEEEQESPREATRLPLNLNTFKFIKGEPTQGRETPLQFTGPVILDALESQNVIYFTVDEADTLFRIYAEHEGIVVALMKGDQQIAKMPDITKTLEKGEYKIQFDLGTDEAKRRAAAVQPEIQISLLLATPKAKQYYKDSMGPELANHCHRDSNFPLALRQQKQADLHQLYYSYPIVKVSEENLQSKMVLQTYHFRVNVTSRLYFEVGMHLINNHVALSMQTLGNTGEVIRGKQRGNLNVMDIQVGPGDYSVAITQIGRMGSQAARCGAFSLQGLLEPIDLMSASANSGEILQRGVIQCPEAANGDQLPPKIYGSKSQTRGGGELHVDATGHFMRKFRNLLFKLSREGIATRPEHSYLEITPVENAVLHLAFLFKSEGGRDIKVILTDTAMFSQEVKPQAYHKRSDIEGGHTELITEHHLSKGGHYALQIIYLGSTVADSRGQIRCPTYDLTMAITHVPAILADSTCKAEREGGPRSLRAGLKHVITDKDLSSDGTYSFDQVLAVRYPQDFKHLVRVTEKGKLMDSMFETVSIDLSNNYDLRASIDFEFDQALYTIGFTESAQGEAGEWQTEASHEQSPLIFKRNNDHYKAVRRELVAEGVESHSRTRKHTLTLTSWQWLHSQDGTHLLAQAGQDACFMVNVKIFIKSAKPMSNLYNSQSQATRNAHPMLIGTRPDESPVFVHGRPKSINFEAIFSTRPYLRHHEEHEKNDEQRIVEAFKLQAVSVNLKDGKRSTLMLEPTNVVCSSKEYQDQEYHVSIYFDLSKIESTASEKLVHAQLNVLNALLVDANNRNFDMEESLFKRGLPIYVFEEVDQEEFMREEGDDVRRGLDGSEAGDEAAKIAAGDVSIEKSDLEDSVASIKKALEKINIETECLCVHGKCKEGSQECNGGCDEGWTGKYCSTPTQKEAFKHVVQRGRKDYTADGLYRPQVILDQSVTSINRNERENKDSSSSAMISRPKKIDGDEKSSHSTALQEQVAHIGEISAGQITVPPADETSSSSSDT